MDPNEIPIPPEFVPPPEGPVRPPVVTTGSASTAPPQQPSMLDRLRQQVMQDIMPNDAADMQRRARTFGAAMMGTPGSFFQGVAAGQQAIEQQRLAEQQARAQRVRSAEEDAYRQAQIQLKEAEQRYNQDPTNPRNRLYLAEAERAMGMANYYLQGGRGGAGGPRPLSAAQYATIVNQADTEARRQFPDPPPGMPEPTNVVEERRRNREAYRDARIAALMEGAAQIQAGNLPTPRPAGPSQGPQGQRVQLPLTGTPRPAPTER